MAFDQAQSSRLGQKTPIESTYVQIYTGTELPEAAWPGQLVFRSDQKILQVRNGDADGGKGAWEDVSGGIAGHLTFVGEEMPDEGPFTEGDNWYDSAHGMKQYVWNGTAWVPVDPNMPSWPGNEYGHIPADNITGGSFLNGVVIN